MRLRPTVLAPQESFVAILAQNFILNITSQSVYQHVHIAFLRQGSNDESAFDVDVVELGMQGPNWLFLPDVRVPHQAKRLSITIFVTTQTTDEPVAQCSVAFMWPVRIDWQVTVFEKLIY